MLYLTKQPCSAERVGLGEEIRPVSEARERIKEAAKLGFTRIVSEKKLEQVAELLGS